MQVNLLPHQFEMISDTTSPLISCVAGLGAGKTTAACYKALHLAQMSPPHVPGMICEPTYPMCRDVLKPTMDPRSEWPRPTKAGGFKCGLGNP